VLVRLQALLLLLLAISAACVVGWMLLLLLLLLLDVRKSLLSCYLLYVIAKAHE
jgi:hypothetical protein